MHRVTFIPQGLTTRAPDGATIFDAANWAGLALDGTCGGRGTCGKCRVRRNAGGWELACRTPIHEDCTVEVPARAGRLRTIPFGLHREVALCPNVHRVVLSLTEPSLTDARSDLLRLSDALREAGYGIRQTPGAMRQLPRLLRGSASTVTAVVCGDELIAMEAGNTEDPCLGLALDVGTTTVAGAIANLKTGAVEASDSVLNGQAAYGADVIARISHAAEPHGLADLQACLIETINALVAKLVERCGTTRELIYETVAVGNTTMLHLLLGIDPTGIGVSPFVPAFQDPVTVRAADLGLRLHPEARLNTLPILGAYVGADIVAGLLATEFLRPQDDELRLFIDAGTNGEIVLRRGDRCLCAAAPAGPAFEGAQIQCGMRASAGAIEHVKITDDVHLGMIGGNERPVGICGSGLIDAVAELRRCGLIDQSGRFARREEARGRVPDAVADRLVDCHGCAAFLLSAPEDAVVLTQADVRALQYAKAAIAAGTGVLLSRFGARCEDIHAVLLAGAFGSCLDTGSARTIGLAPPVELGRIRSAGNAAGEGALVALLSRGEWEAARQMPLYLEYIELAADRGFHDRYAEALGFPLARQGPADSQKA